MTSWADASDDPALEQAPAEFTGGAGGRPRLQLKPRSKTAAAAQNSPAGGSSSIFGAAKPREAVLASKGIDASEVDKRVERKASVARLSAEQDKQVEALRAALTEVEEKLREANEMELPEEDYRVDAEKKRNDLNELIKGFQETNLKERNERTTSSKGGGGDQQPDDAPAAGDSAAWGGLSTGGAPNGSKNEGRGGGGDGSQRKFERPSERRRRLEQQRGDHEGGGGGGGYNNNNHRGSRGGYNDYDNNEGGDDTFSSFGGNRNRGGRGGGGGGGGYHGGDRRGSDNRGNQRGGYNDRGGSYNDRGGSYNDDKYAGDRYNY